MPMINEEYRGLTYPWGRKDAIKVGEPKEVAPGVWWVRFAMPGGLDHINIWLLEDEGGWTVVDTCMKLDSAKDQWEALFSGFMQGKPIVRVICTHLHPDHIGLAGWLCERFDCDVWMTRSEYLNASLLLSYTDEGIPDTALRFYKRAGFTDEMLSTYRRRFGTFGKMSEPLPHSYRRIVDLETINIGNHYWQVVIGQGHSPEHACLYCPGLKLIISGDQILPRITPNVSVFPTEPDGNPLEYWLSSNTRLLDILPEDLLVLPAHQTPFKGARTRLNQIIDGHRQSLARLYDFLATPRTVPECFDVMFNRQISDGEIQFATGETLAHLNYLVQNGNITRSVDEAGLHSYRANPHAHYIHLDEAAA
jgi:glyoxylase-like metal-dependent hydrolase (beta-lactamase superfamily II)